MSDKDERIVTPLESLAVPIEPYYSMLDVGHRSGPRPIATDFPLFSARRGPIEFKQWTPEELAAQEAERKRHAKVTRRRRALARPFHWLARPLNWLAYAIGPEIDRPRPDEDDDW